MYRTLLAILLLSTNIYAGDVIIAFKKQPGNPERKLITDNGGTIKHHYTIVPAIAANLSDKAIAKLKTHKDVAIIEPDIEIQAVDAELDNSWGVQKIGGGIAYNNGFSGAGVNVAIIDSGVDYRHPDLAANYAGGYDFVNNDTDPLDDYGHGTHVAGTIAAVKDGNGVVGVAPSCKIYALKVLASNGSGSYSNVIAALDWCVNNKTIAITNNSYGSSANPGLTVEQAFINAYNANILNIAAAGNYGTAAGTEDNIIYPAKYSTVLAVGAVDSNDYRASWSCTGPDLELAAPGVNIYSTLPNGSYGYYSGTSMACPHVAGAAAVVVGAATQYWGVSTNDYVSDMLKMSALDLGVAGNDTWYGSGRVQVDQALVAVSLTKPSAPPPPVAAIMHVNNIKYSLSGPKGRDLTISIYVVDANYNGLGGVSVTAAVKFNGVNKYNISGNTNGQGILTYKINNALAGQYSTNVTNATKSGYKWDGISDIYSFVK